MTQKQKNKQRILRVAIAVILVAVALLVEFVGMHPAGIYTYRYRGYKDFQIGLSKQAVLQQINRVKTIRTVKTCDPAWTYTRNSRKKLTMNAHLSGADIWICHDRTGKDFLFVFDGDEVRKLLIQRLRFGKKQGSALFSDCRVISANDLSTYLETVETLPVYPEKNK